MKFLILSLLLAACGGTIDSPLNICTEIDAATNDAGACTFTPTHPPLGDTDAQIR